MKKALLALIISLLVFSPFSPDLSGGLSFFRFGQAEIVAPALISENTVWTKDGGPYHIYRDNLTVPAGISLTIEAGTIVKLDTYGINVYGELIVSGTTEEPVVFSSLNDDTAGGQTSPWSSGQPQAGDWSSLKTMGGEIRLENARLSFGGERYLAMVKEPRPHLFRPQAAQAQFSLDTGALSCDSGLIQAEGLELFDNVIGLEAYAVCNASVASSTIRNNNIGVLVYEDQAGPGIILNSSEIYENEEYAVRNESDLAVDARHNWWGHPSGPLHYADNPQGQGDPIYGKILFDPWVGKDENQAPLLDFSAEPGYQEDEAGLGVEPNRGKAAETAFVFKLVYSDQDNDPPSELELVVKNGENSIIFDLVEDGQAQETWHNSNFVDGEQYFVSASFPSGEYIYYFRASDGKESVRLPESGYLGFSAGNSSLVFLPGIKASRLYRRGILFENQLWEPNRNADVEKLFLDETGQSLEADVYTRDVIDEVFGVTMNIYKSFLEDMEEMEESEIVKEAVYFPYDWRQGIDEAVERPVKLEDEEFYMLDRLEAMAGVSQTGQVTIVAHSMGGLVAKELVQRLEGAGKAGLVDRLILVASPQAGTPDAAIALLHGDGQDMLRGVLLDKPTARTFGLQMKSAYSLLPTEKYLDSASGPVIEFDADSDFLADLRGRYGESISASGTLEAFLLAKDWRVAPDPVDTDTPAHLSESMLSEAWVLHDRWDNWVPPAGLQVIQVVGWGLDTVSGLRYREKTILVCPDGNYDDMSDCTYVQTFDREPIFSIEGDGVVIMNSAEMIKGVETYYLDLGRFNDFNVFNREHADIFETQPLRILVSSLVSTTTGILPRYILTDGEDLARDFDYLRIAVHSPVSLDVYSASGLHTGLIPNPDPESDLRLFEEQIPNSYYLEFGESKYTGISVGEETRVDLKGTGSGVFTLEITAVSGERAEIENTIAFKDVPVTPQTRAQLLLSDSGDIGNLEIDIDGDGEVDLSLDPFALEPGPLVYIAEIESYIKNSTIKKGTKMLLLAELKVIRRLVEKDKVSAAKILLSVMEKHIQKISKRHISEEIRQELLEMVSNLREIIV